MSEEVHLSEFGQDIMLYLFPSISSVHGSQDTLLLSILQN